MTTYYVTVDQQGHVLVTYRTKLDAENALRAQRATQAICGLRPGHLDYRTVSVVARERPAHNCGACPKCQRAQATEGV